jgi:protein involved in polysaccharide export with SLBB domain
LPNQQQQNGLPASGASQPAPSAPPSPTQVPAGTNPSDVVPSFTDSSGITYVPCEPSTQGPSGTASQKTSDTTPLANQSTMETSEESSATQRTAKSITSDLRHYAPEINWDYAIIQRVNPTDLTSKLLWLSPRKAIIEHDESATLELQPGDTMHSVLQRAGGLTPNAYVYGSQLLRESARLEQQNSLDQLVRTMEVQVRQATLSIASTGAGGDAQQLAQLQEGIISQLRGIRATGRVSLPVRPSDKKITDFPNMLLEDNDRLIIPHVPSTVSVVGNVYNPGSFIFDSHLKSGAYLEMAGKGKPQSDMHHAFVLRANGVVVAANNVNGPFTGSKFDHLRLYPGDEIIVPYKLPTGAFVRGLRDWSQITSQLAITAAALAVVVP